MNDDHQHRRVWWDGHKGGAYFDGVEIYLRRAPKITGIKQVVEIEFSPKLGVFEVREYRKLHRRPLTEPEKLDVEARLGRMHNGAQDAWA